MYTTKLNIPQYEPKNPPPELRNTMKLDKFNELILVDNSYTSTVKSILDNMGVIEF